LYKSFQSPLLNLKTMSCKTRTELETAVDAAFSDLIDNTALQCEQVDHQQKHNLWAMGGIIRITWNSTTNENDLEWYSNASTFYTGINLGPTTTPSLSWYPATGNANRIRITYPDAFATSASQQVCPVQVQATPYFGLIDGGSADGGFKVAAEASNASFDIFLSRYMPMTGIAFYSSTTGWGLTGVSPLPSNAFLGSTPTYSSGVISISRVHRGLPTIIPMVNNMTPQYTPVINSDNGTVLTLKMRDESTGLYYTGAAIDQWTFGIDYGIEDSLINPRTTNFGSTSYINVSGLFETRPL
jgi:hypothetical protein